MIIGINGYSGSGKDTLGVLIQYINCFNVGEVSIEDILNDYTSHQWWLEEQSGWEIKKYAGKLKTIGSLLTGIPVEKFEDQEFKKTRLSSEWNIHGMPMTVREFLQKLGTDALRDGLHSNAWVNALFADYKKEFSECGVSKAGTTINCAKYPNWVITDVRFPNEAKAIKDRGGVMIRIDRPFVKPINNHPSEISLDTWKFDYKIANVSDLVSLKFTIKNILEEVNENNKTKN
jgi:hypothetical protein